MHPELFSIGPLTLHTYGFFMAVGVLFATSFLLRYSGEVGLNKNEMVDAVLVILVAGMAGARLLYVVYDWEFFARNPIRILAIWQGGIIFYGGLILGLTAFCVLVFLKRLPLLKTLDLFTQALALTQGFGRIGCFLNGCCYGKPTSCPLGVQFPFSENSLHPTQLYEAAFCFALFFTLNAVYRKKKVEAGFTSFLYFFLYGTWRFGIEFLRDDMARLGFGLTLGQWMSVGTLAMLALIVLFIRFCRHAR